MRRYLGSLALVAGAATATELAATQGTPAHGLRDEAAMVLVGAALFGLAAAVRRAA